MFVRSVPGFSISIFAVANAPTSHPARVKGTHGAGAILPLSSIVGVVSTDEYVTGSVQ